MYVTQIGYPPLCIDILNSISGVSFAEAFSHKQVVDTDGLTINYIGLGALIKNKAAAGRDKDLIDIKSLEKQQPKSPKRKES
jgi:predicted nucleotidyltransferase